MKQNSQTLGTLLVILAGVCWGVISIFIRGLNRMGFDSMHILFLRAWFSAILLLVYLLIKDRSLLKIRLKDLWMFVGTGILSMTFFCYCYFTSIVRAGAAVAVVLLYTSPVFVMLMSAVVFREKITKKKVAALVMTFAGCVLVAGLVGSSTPLTPAALLLGLGAGFGYALYSIFGGFAVRRYTSLTITFYTLLFSGISLIFLLDMGSTLGQLRDTAAAGWPYMLGIAAICTVVPYIAYTAGLARMEAGRAAVLVTVEPLVGSLLGILAYREPADLAKLGGILLIFAAVVLLSRGE